MPVKSNISIALPKEEANSDLLEAMEAYGLTRVTDCLLSGLEEDDFILYSNGAAPLSTSLDDWILLHPRAQLKWILGQVLAGVKHIAGSAHPDELNFDLLGDIKREAWHIQLRLGAPDFDIDFAADVLATILRLADFNSEREQKKLRVVALEAMTNAWEHGYECDKSKQIDVTYEVSSKGMRIAVEHQGLGFNLEDVPDPMAPENLLSESGRGILIMSNTLDQLNYENGGRRLVGYKNFKTD